MRLLVLLILAATTVLLIILRAWRPRGQHGTAAEPRCGNCGYIVRGIAGVICPECGRDLREVGIDVGKTPGRRPTWILGVFLAIGWTFLMYELSWLPNSTIRTLVGQRIIFTGTLSEPQSEAFREVSIQGSDTWRSAAPTPARISALMPKRTLRLLKLDGQVATMDVDLSTGQYSWQTSTGTTSGSGFGVATITAWMKDISVDTSAPTSISEIFEIVATARQYPSDVGFLRGGSHSTSGGTRVFSSAMHNWSSTSRAGNWLSPTLQAFWFILWLAGGCWILWRSISSPQRH